MIGVIRKFLSSSFRRYLFVGGMSYAIELSLLVLLASVIGIHRTSAVAITFWVSIVISFLLQKFIAFKDRQRLRRTLSKQAVLYACLVVMNYLVTILVVSLFDDKYLIASRTFALALTTTWNYFIYKHLIFKEGSHQKKSLPKESHFRNYINSIKQNPRQLIFPVAIVAIIVVYFWQYAFTGNKTLMGDFDYYSQLYEAFRISVLHYQQLPLWDPWLAGGVPLIANPQFGLVSIQSVCVLLFGTIFGLKVAYLMYAIAGFFGMYILTTRAFNAERLRATLVSLLWVFGGFFAGHTIAHLTFTLFFLLPWVYFFILKRTSRWSWVGFGGIISLILLSSVHYALLMISLMALFLFTFSLLRLYARRTQKGLRFGLEIKIHKHDILFAIKSVLLIVLLTGWQFAITYSYVSQNERINHIPENNPTLGLMFQQLFMPIGTLLPFPTTTWGWGEYSMQIGIGSLLALVVILVTAVYFFSKRTQKLHLVSNPAALLSVAAVGIIGLLFALGDFSAHSPFTILKTLPGFTQTRLPSRWLIFTVLALLVLFASWKHNKKTVNVLLFLAALELFFTNGPPRVQGHNMVDLPRASFNETFTQHDNNHQHYGYGTIPMNYYYFTTTQNIGQIYADDSLVNTLAKESRQQTIRCADNSTPDCSLVLSHNAHITYWSPNKIILKRDGPGDIELNINVESGWRVNNRYPFFERKKIDPSVPFLVSERSEVITLEYAPKLSPSWIVWKIKRN